MNKIITYSRKRRADFIKYLVFSTGLIFAIIISIGCGSANPSSSNSNGAIMVPQSFLCSIDGIISNSSVPLADIEVIVTNNGALFTTNTYSDPNGNYQLLFNLDTFLFITANYPSNVVYSNFIPGTTAIYSNYFTIILHDTNNAYADITTNILEYLYYATNDSPYWFLTATNTNVNPVLTRQPR